MQKLHKTTLVAAGSLTPSEAAAVTAFSNNAPDKEAHRPVFEQLLNTINNKFWITCPCKKVNDVFLSPLLYSRRYTAADGTSMIRAHALESGNRPSHADSCEFHYQDLDREADKKKARVGKRPVFKHTKPDYLADKKSDLDTSKPAEKYRPITTTGGKRLTKLARILFMLLEDAGATKLQLPMLKNLALPMLTNEAKAERKNFYNAWCSLLRTQAKTIKLTKGSSLNDVLFFSSDALTNGAINKALSKLELPDGKLPTGYLILPTARVEKNKVCSVKKSKDAAGQPITEEFNVVHTEFPVTRLTVFGYDIASPYLAILKIVKKPIPAALVGQPCCYGSLVVEDGYAHPIFDFKVPIPMDSNRERNTLLILAKCLSGLEFTGSVMKPLFSEEKLDGYRPDFRIDNSDDIPIGFIECLGFSFADYLAFKQEMVEYLSGKGYFALKHDCTTNNPEQQAVSDAQFCTELTDLCRAH